MERIRKQWRKEEDHTPGFAKRLGFRDVWLVACPLTTMWRRTNVSDGQPPPRDDSILQAAK